MRELMMAGAVLLAACAAAPEATTTHVGFGPNCNDTTVSRILASQRSNPSNADKSSSVATPGKQILADEINARRANFGPLAGLIGRCYKGTPTGESAEQVADIQHWSTALGGAAITIEHALEDGSYGGISYVYPNAGSDDFTYVYITNAGFHTQGTITLDGDGSFTASETVDGHPTITEVRSVTTFNETGMLSMTSEFLDDGAWKPGPSFTHEVTIEAFPRLQAPKSDTAD